MRPPPGRTRATRPPTSTCCAGPRARPRSAPRAPSAPGRPAPACWEAAILAPLGPLDAYALLDLDDPVERLQRITALLADEIEALQFRLSG